MVLTADRAKPRDRAWPGASPRTDAAESLAYVGRWLMEAGYAFTAVTPATHARVLARQPGRVAVTLRDAFGWNLPFERRWLPRALITALADAEALDILTGERVRSRLRCATLEHLLLFHSSYPTQAADAVFCGPDTYRFASLIEHALSLHAPHGLRVVDVGCGTGAGGLLAGSLLGRGARIVLVDINPRAVELARVNARLAGQGDVECVRSDVLAAVSGRIDLVLANAPYLADPLHRCYRDGGGRHGEGLSIRFVRETLPRLSPGGRLVLYTGSAIVDGRDALRAELEPLLAAAGAAWTYLQIDPDVFGEALDTPAYATVERIAIVALIAWRRWEAA